MLQHGHNSELLRTRPRLLLVDDNVQLLELSGCLFTLAGYSVITATHPNRAIVLAKREKPDLAVLDYSLPVMDGCMLADRLRVMMPRLPVILYSGSLDIADRDLSRVDVFVSKSQGPQVLLSTVIRLLNNSEEPDKLRQRIKCSDIQREVLDRKWIIKHASGLQQVATPECRREK